MTDRKIAIPGRPMLISGWGRTSPTLANVLRPTSRTQAEAVIWSRPHRGAVARGLGRSYGDPAQNAGGFVLDMTAMNRVNSADLRTGLIDVEAGISLDTLIRRFVPAGWFVPVTPGTRHVTVGGAIAADIHGKNHHQDGGFGKSVVDVDLATPTGKLERVDRQNDSETFKATIGGMGLTGLILRATLRMIPLQTSLMSVDTERSPNLDDMMQRMIADDEDYHYSVAWIDTLARGSSLGRGVLYRANHARLEVLPEEDQSEPLELKIPPAPSIPAPLPASPVSLPAVAAFNEFWFRRHPPEERGRLQGLTQYFHQLDLVNNVNFVYGLHGLIQHQCVIPDGQEGILRSILQRLSDARCPCFLAVLKRMGAGDGLLSFPIAGWTLAVDAPALWDADGSFFDGIDELVARAGGRLYLAKDSRTRPELIETMYPEISTWRKIAGRLDPEHVLRSDLDRRLRLRAE